MMDRRAFLAGSLGPLAAPLAAGAQAGKVHRIGFLGLSSPADYAANLQAFRQGLRDLGYEEGKNISIEYRWAEGRDERLPALAAELVRLNPDVLVTHAIPGIRAAQHATSTIPIVMGVSADPVRQGLVKSLAKPGGNTTGVSSQLIELAAKRLELLREAVPNLRQVAVLSNLANATAREAVKETEVAGRTLGVRVRSFGVGRGPTELETEFSPPIAGSARDQVRRPWPAARWPAAQRGGRAGSATTGSRGASVDAAIAASPGWSGGSASASSRTTSSCSAGRALESGIGAISMGPHDRMNERADCPTGRGLTSEAALL